MYGCKLDGCSECIGSSSHVSSTYPYIFCGCSECIDRWSVVSYVDISRLLSACAAGYGMNMCFGRPNRLCGVALKFRYIGRMYPYHLRGIATCYRSFTSHVAPGFWARLSALGSFPHPCSFSCCEMQQSRVMAYRDSHRLAHEPDSRESDTDSQGAPHMGPPRRSRFLLRGY